MNILFFENYIDPQKGGVQRVTYSLAEQFKARGYNCFVVHECYDNYKEIDKDAFSGILYFSFKSDRLSLLEEFIASNRIDIVINQLARNKRAVNGFYKLQSKFGYKLISELHTSPNSSLESSRYMNIRYPKDFFRSLLKRVCLSFYRIDVSQMKNAYFKSDQFVVLSESFIPELRKMLNVDGKKIAAIANPCTYSQCYSLEDLSKKKKEILVVSRINENPKRISMILDIWKLLYRKYPEWSLNIIGEGESLSKYKQRIKDMGLENIRFLGKKNPLSYYQYSSIFYMTSIFEGLPMTLIEAQQMGVVPIAFDSFTALHDIISDGENGRIIPECNLEEYASASSILMQNSMLRKKMGKKAIRSVSKFSREEITNQWIKLFYR